MLTYIMHNSQALYTFTVYPSKSYFAFVLERFSEFCSSLSHIEGLAGLHTLMPIPPQAIEKAGKNNPLGLDRAKPDTSLSGQCFVFFYQISQVAR